MANEQVGASPQNFKEGGGKSKIFLLMGIFITFALFVIAIEVSVNIWLHKNNILNIWQFYGIEKLKVIYITMWYQDIAIKKDFMMYLGFPFAVVLLLSAVIFRAYNATAKMSRPTGTRHGTSRFANEKEIIESKLVISDVLKFFENPEETGVVLGLVNFGTDEKPKMKYLIERSANEHVIAYAPSRSGKGVGLVIPSLFTWKDSAIVLDPKGENFEKTSGYLESQGHICIRLDLGMPYHRYNPLSDIDPKNIQLSGEVMRAIGIIMDEGAKKGGGDNKFWDNQAKNMMTMFLTYLIATFKPLYDKKNNLIKSNISMYDLGMMLNSQNPITGKTITGYILSSIDNPLAFKDFCEKHDKKFKVEDFIEVSDFTDAALTDFNKLKSGGTNAAITVTTMSNMVAACRKVANYYNDYRYHINERGKTYFAMIGEFLSSYAEGFVATPEQTLQNVVVSCTQYLNIFLEPVIAAITSQSDFKLRDLVDPTGKPCIVYVVNPPKEELTGKTDPIIKLVLQNLFVSVLYETGLRTKIDEYRDALNTHLNDFVKQTVNYEELTKLLTKEEHDLEVLASAKGILVENLTEEENTTKNQLITKRKAQRELLDQIYYLPVEVMVLDRLIIQPELTKYKELLTKLINKQIIQINKTDRENIIGLLKEPKYIEIAAIKYGWTKRSVLCMLDEFPKLGKFGIMEKLLADAAGYGAKIYLIAQSDKQIYEAYGKENSIFAGCTHKVMYRPGDFDTAKALSDMLGKYTYVEKTINTSDTSNGSLDILSRKSVSSSWNESAKDLLSPDEIMRLKDNESIIISKRIRIRGEKYVYWKDPAMDPKSRMAQVEISVKSIVQNHEITDKKLADRGIYVNADGTWEDTHGFKIEEEVERVDIL